MLSMLRVAVSKLNLSCAYPKVSMQLYISWQIYTTTPRSKTLGQYGPYSVALAHVHGNVFGNHRHFHRRFNALISFSYIFSLPCSQYQVNYLCVRSYIMYPVHVTVLALATTRSRCSSLGALLNLPVVTKTLATFNVYMLCV